MVEYPLFPYAIYCLLFLSRSVIIRYSYILAALPYSPYNVDILMQFDWAVLNEKLIIEVMFV